MLNPKIISYSDEESLKSIIERNRFDLKLFGTSKRRLADFLESFLNMESNEKFTITKENWCDPHKCPFGCDENSGIDINVYSKEFQETIKFNSLHIHTIREHCFEGEDGSYQLNLNWVMIMLNLPSKHKIKWQFTSNFTPVYYFSEGFLTKLKINKKNPFYYKISELELTSSVYGDCEVMRFDFVGNKMYDLLIFSDNPPLWGGNNDTYLQRCLEYRKQYNIKCKIDNYVFPTIQELKEELDLVKNLVKQKDYKKLNEVSKLVVHSPESKKWLFSKLFDYHICIWPGSNTYRLDYEEEK